MTTKRADVTSLKILDAKMSNDDLAWLVGVPKARVREWIYRYRVIGSGPSLAKKEKGHFGTRAYSFAEAMTLAAARALEEDVPLAVRNAAKAVAGRGDIIVDKLFARHETMWTSFAEDRPARAFATIRPLAIYTEMQPRLAALFPEETEELDRYLASGFSIANAHD